MANDDKESCFPKTILEKLRLKPFTKSHIIGFYIPAQGFLSYAALSVNVINPNLYLTVLPKRDVTNILLFNAILGTGIYLYERKHMKNVERNKRILYSAFGAVLFSLGSVLFWAVIRGSIPVRSTAIGVSLGIASSIGLVKLATGYLDEIDNAVTAEEE